MGRQRGVALISVLLIVVLISSLAFQLYSHQSLTTTQARMSLEVSQLRELLLASEVYATDLLYEDWMNEETRFSDDELEYWGARVHSHGHEIGRLDFQIRDQSARLNLNSIAASDFEVPMRVFQSVLSDRGHELDLVALWRDWVDKDDTVFLAAYQEGREDLGWLANTPSFRTPNTLASDISEMYILASLNRGEYDQIAELVTVLPNSGLKLNINTAPSELLLALLPSAQPTLPVISSASSRRYNQLEDFVKEHDSFESVQKYLDIRSEFFEVRSSVVGFDLSMSMTSHIQRDPDTGEMVVYSRNLGVSHSAVSPAS